MDKKPKYEFNQQSATQNLRSQEVIFSITNPKLDDIFNKEFGQIADYVEKDGDIYYFLSPQDYDRFLDFAISSGYDVDRYINQIDDINEEGNVTGGGEAYLPAMNVPTKKQNPFKEGLQEYFIQVDVRDAKLALAIIDDSYSLSNTIKKRGTDVYTTFDAMAAEELVDSLKQNGIKSKNNVDGNIDEDALSGYTQDKNFRPGHTTDKGGFQYKDLWGVNEIKHDQKVKITKGEYAGRTGVVHDFNFDKDNMVDVIIDAPTSPMKKIKSSDLKTLSEDVTKTNTKELARLEDKQKGINEAKEEWAIKNIEALIIDYAAGNNLNFFPVGKKQYPKPYGAKTTVYMYKLKDKDLVIVDDKVANAPRLNDFRVIIGTLEPGSTVVKNSSSVSKFGSYGTEDIIKMLDKIFGNKELKELDTKLNKAKTSIKETVLHEMNQIIDEVFTRADHKIILKIIDKIKYTNTKLYNHILDMMIDIYPHSLDEIPPTGLNENYYKFRNETSKRTKPEQFHQAVKSVKRKVEEISKLYEYMERLKMELSESEDGLKYRKYTENAMAKIKESVKQLHIKTKKLR